MGCGGEARVDPERGSQSNRADASPVVARIGDDEIHLSQVEAYVRAHRVAPTEALRQIENAALLYQEAVRRGYAREGHVAEETKRIAVQRLLQREVEDQVPLTSVSAEAVHALYASRRARYMHPELRKSSHLLARVPRTASNDASEAARAVVAQVIAEMRGGDPTSVLARYAQAGRIHGVEVVVEDVPFLARDAEAAPEYLQALYERSVDGDRVVPEPIRTDFGWHAIVLEAVRSPENRTEADVENELRAELVVSPRESRVNALLAQLSERTPPVSDERVVDRVIASDVEAAP